MVYLVDTIRQRVKIEKCRKDIITGDKDARRKITVSGSNLFSNATTQTGHSHSNGRNWHKIGQSSCAQVFLLCREPPIRTITKRINANKQAFLITCWCGMRDSHTNATKTGTTPSKIKFGSTSIRRTAWYAWGKAWLLFVKCGWQGQGQNFEN
jgi:hypothetical protein